MKIVMTMYLVFTYEISITYIKIFIILMIYSVTIIINTYMHIILNYFYDIIYYDIYLH